MEDQVISIPGVQKERFQVTIIGDTPLLTQRMSEEVQESIADKQQGKPQGAKAARNPEAEYQASIYYTEDGKPGFPADGIKKACVNACRFNEIQMTKARGAFFVLGDKLAVEGEHRFREDWGKLKGRISTPIYRAEFPEWSITFDIVHDPRIISKESIVNMLELAGFHIGIGGYRPECNGTFGMFHVKRESG